MKAGVITMQKKANERLRLQEFNSYDIERILRENVYDLDVENKRIEGMVNEMLLQKIPTTIILKWLNQLQNNASEIVYVNSLVQHDLSSYNFSDNTMFKIRRVE